MSHELTIEQVDKEVEAMEKKHANKLAAADAITLDPATILAKVCGIVSVAVPILKFLKRITFFKPKWQTIIQRIIDIEGMVCGTTE